MDAILIDEYDRQASFAMTPAPKVSQPTVEQRRRACAAAADARRGVSPQQVALPPRLTRLQHSQRMAELSSFIAPEKQ